MKTLHNLGVLSVVLMVAACGGDDDGGGGPAAQPQAQNEVPQSALASAEAFSLFVGSLPASDTTEGLVLKDADAPVNDTGPALPVS